MPPLQRNAWRYFPPVPMLIGWSMVVLCALDITATTETRIGNFVKAFFSGTIVGEAADDGTPRPLAKTLIAMAWPIAFVGVVVFFGFVVAIPSYIFLFVVFQGRKSVRLALISAVSTVAFTYVVFEKLLQYEVFGGLLFGG